jgi:O-ureido-D-serine cyclo-ligase
VAHDVDDDLAPLTAALEAAGAEVAVEDWHDDDVDWRGFDLALVRSPWDYSSRRDEFLAWARRASSATRLVNPVEVLVWNTDKRYLDHLAAAGVPVVPTQFVSPGDHLEVPTSGEFVVKPTVSAGSRDTARYHAARPEPAVAHARSLLAAGSDVMIQPYLGSVDTAGEVAVIAFGGRRSHAVRKGPLLAVGAAPTRALFAPEHITPHVLADDEAAAADHVLATLARVPGVGAHLSPPAYARVDLVRDDSGRPVLLELELCEPSVFLDEADGAAERFAATIMELVRPQEGPT